MYLTIVFLPLIGAITAGFFGRFIGKNGASIITVICVSLSVFLSLIAFYEVGLCQSVCYVSLGRWVDSEMFKADWGLMFDSLTVVMLLVVLIVSALVHVYSIAYMSEDPHRPRFMAYLSLFTFFMLMLVTADNFIQMFLGWEGVGLSSYLLINFWFTRLQANKSAIKAMLVNRVGDFGLALGIMAIYSTMSSVEYTTVFAAAAHCAEGTGENFVLLNMQVDKLTAICGLLFIGAVGKSAQIGLHTWLPDAMEGPTPVSALIHAATMVTAGVFLIIRCSPLFELAPKASLVITLMGATTAFFAATTALLQNDLKKVVAYSTCSQLGYMIFACGISNYSASIFHLMNHAFFKALLFLSAGAVIHGFMDEQDMRKMGGLARVLPFTYVSVLIGSMSLVGFPFLTGFYSKDFILELAFAKYTFAGNFAHWLGTLSVFFTCFYSFRLIFLTFLNKTNAYRPVVANVHEVGPLTAFPLIVLALGSIFVGYVMKDMMIGLGTNFWGNALFMIPANEVHTNAEFLPTFVRNIPLLFTASGAFLSFVLVHKGVWTVFASSSLRNESFEGTAASRFLRRAYIFLNRKWYFDKVYNHYITSFFLSLGYNITFKAIDKGIIELLGPYGISVCIYDAAGKVTKLQTGYIYHYAFVIFVGCFAAVAALFVAPLWGA